MNKKQFERSVLVAVLVADAVLILSGLLLYFYLDQNYSDFIVKVMVVIAVVHSTIGFFYKFSFRGEYPYDTVLNDLMRLGTMLICIGIAIFLFVF